MSKIKNIAEGWKKYIFGGIDDATKEMAEKRLNKCLSNKCRKYDDTLAPVCRECKCPIKVKILVKDEKCGLGYW